MAGRDKTTRIAWPRYSAAGTVSTVSFSGFRSSVRKFHSFPDYTCTHCTYNLPPPLFKLFVLTFSNIPDWINSRKNKKRDETIHESFAGNTQIPFPRLKKKRRRRRRLFPRSIQLHSVSNERYVPRIPRDKERPRSSLIGRWRNRRFRHYHHGQRVDPLSRPGGRLKYCQVADISHGLTEWLPFLAGS